MWNIDRLLASFGDKETERLWRGRRARLPADLLLRATDKLNLLDAATSLDTLRIPPSNRLEALKGDLAGQHSIRINDQWRICFRWQDGNAHLRLDHLWIIYPGDRTYPLGENIILGGGGRKG